jgi:hypothetical protein
MGLALTTTLSPSRVTQPAELFALGDLMKYWNADWKLERAGFGGAGGGLKGLRGITFLNGDVLATYPRDEVRGLLLRRSMRLSRQPFLRLHVAADPGRAWQLSAINSGDPRPIERVLRDYHDRVVAAGGVLYHFPPRFKDPEKQALALAVVACAGDLVAAQYPRDLQGGSETKWLLGAKRTHPALQQLSARRHLPTRADHNTTPFCEPLLTDPSASWWS